MLALSWVVVVYRSPWELKGISRGWTQLLTNNSTSAPPPPPNSSPSSCQMENCNLSLQRTHLHCFRELIVSALYNVLISNCCTVINDFYETITFHLCFNCNLVRLLSWWSFTRFCLCHQIPSTEPCRSSWRLSQLTNDSTQALQHQHNWINADVFKLKFKVILFLLICHWSLGTLWLFM